MALPIVNEGSAYAQELRKWNKPWHYEPFPKMLYKAQLKNGRAMVNDAADERFSASCQLVVNDEDQLRRAHNDGWRDDPNEALAHFEGLQKDIARAASERAYRDSKMSEAAQAEALEADRATSEHLPEIPEKPRRGRPRKVEAAA